MLSGSSLLKQSALLYFPKLLAWVLSYLAFSYLIRVKGAAEYGGYVILTSYWGIPAMLAGDILGASSQRLLAAARSRGEEAVRAAVASVWRLHALSLLAIGVLAFAFLRPINTWVFHSDDLVEHPWIGLALFAGLASLAFFRYVLRGLNLVKQTLVMDMTESILRNGLWLAVCLGAASALTLTSAAALALWVAAAVNYPILTHKGYSPFQQNLARSEDQREAMFQARAFVLIFFCTYILNAAPAVMLNRVHGAEAAGMYAALFRIVDFATGPILAVAFILAPAATGAKLKGEDEVQQLLLRSFKINILFLPLISCVALGRREIIHIFGLGKYPELESAALAFCLYVFFANISALFGAFADFLGYAHARSRLMLIFSVAFVLAVWAATPSGVIAVAWSMACIYALMVTSYLGLIVRHHGSLFLSANRIFAGKVILCLLLALPAGFLVHDVVSDGATIMDYFIKLVLRSAAFALVFIPLIAAFFVRRRDDRWQLVW